MRICFFGDSFTQGSGDDACLGWVGCISADARRQGVDLTSYNLGVRRDTSEDIRKRWHAEATARLPAGSDTRLVFAFGNNDVALGSDKLDELATSITSNAKEILAPATQMAPTLLIGPVPQTASSNAATRIDVIYDKLEQAAAEFEVPFLDLRPAPAAVWDVWHAEAKQGDGAHPNEGGYRALAGYIGRWPAWQSWLT